MRRLTAIISALLLIAGASAQAQEISKAALDSLMKVKPSGSKSLNFRKPEQNFGELWDDAGERAYEYNFVNNTSQAVEISGITTSCACLVAEASGESIAPGAKGSIVLKFNPHALAGDVAVRAFVYAGGPRPAAVLSLRGKVCISDEWGHFPVIAGCLRLKAKEMHIAEGECCARMLCANSGNSPITPTVDMLPEGVEAHFEPSVIGPGEEADLVVSCTARGIRGGMLVGDGMQRTKIIMIIVD